jgi:tetratricopeptide (TPR) repeat protein
LDIIERFLEKRDDSQIRLLQAHFYSLTGNVAKSREVLSVFPDSAAENPFVSATNARNLLTEGNFNEAIEPARFAYDSNKNLRNLLTLLASLEGAEQNDEGFSLLQQHKSEFPEDIRPRMLLAERKIQRDSSAAIQEYATLVEENDQNFVALNNLAYLTLQEGDAETAQNYAERAVELQPTNAAASDTLAQVYRAQSRLNEALELYERTVDDGMDNEEIYLNYVEVLLEAGNTILAQRRLEQRTIALPESIERLEALKAKFGI